MKLWCLQGIKTKPPTFYSLNLKLGGGEEQNSYWIGYLRSQLYVKSEDYHDCMGEESRDERV
jgi:hypothetical protein